MTFHIDPIPGAVHSTPDPQPRIYLLWNGEQLLAGFQSEADALARRNEVGAYYADLHITALLVTPAGSVTR